MSQVITPPLSGFVIGLGANNIGQVKVLAGSGDPNSASTDSSAGDIASAAVGSLFLRMDGSTSSSLYVCTAPGVWTAK